MPRIIVKAGRGIISEEEWRELSRPKFGKPANLLTTPPSSTAPALELRVQVVDEPAAQRQAEIFNGQTELTFGQPPNRCLKCGRVLIDFGTGPFCPTCDRERKP